MSAAIDALHLAALFVLTAAALFALFRMAQGPTSLDRSVASDVMIAVLIAGIGLYSVHYDDDLGLPILVVLSLLGFTSAVAMARLISNRSDQVRSLHEQTRVRPEESPSEGTLDAWEEDEDLEPRDGEPHD